MDIDEAMTRVIPTAPGGRRRISVYETPPGYAHEGPWSADNGYIVGRGNTPSEALSQVLEPKTT